MTIEMWRTSKSICVLSSVGQGVPHLLTRATPNTIKPFCVVSMVRIHTRLVRERLNTQIKKCYPIDISCVLYL